MAEILVETLKTIERYKAASPHYNELFDILGEILILREEYRQKMKGMAFPLDERLIPHKLSGGLPLLDFSTDDFDFTVPKEYFLRLLEILASQSGNLLNAANCRKSCQACRRA